MKQAQAIEAVGITITTMDIYCMMDQCACGISPEDLEYDAMMSALDRLDREGEGK